MIKTGKELGLNDAYHKYTNVICPKCGNEHWVRVDNVGKQSELCYKCSRGFADRITDESIRKMAESQRARLKRNGLPAYFHRDRHGKNNPMFGKTQTIESIAKNSLSNKENWKNPDYQDKWMKSHLYPYIKQTKPEVELELSLKDFGVEFTGGGLFWIGYPPRNPDFIHRANRKVIEFFGNFWHKQEDELDRINHYKKYNWDCLVVWEADFNKSKTATVDKIKEFIWFGHMS